MQNIKIDKMSENFAEMGMKANIFIAAQQGTNKRLEQAVSKAMDIAQHQHHEKQYQPATSSWRSAVQALQRNQTKNKCLT
jgi:hypothetical protein